MIQQSRKTKSLKQCWFLFGNLSHPFNHQLPLLTFIYQIIFYTDISLPNLKKKKKKLHCSSFSFRPPTFTPPSIHLAYTHYIFKLLPFLIIMMKKGDYNVPCIFNDEEMQTNFHRNFFIRPIAFKRSFAMENFSCLPQIIEISEFQGWNDFMRISKNVYTGLVIAFYSTLAPVDEDNTSLRSIIRSFEIQVFLSDLVHITNTPYEGVLC